MARPLIFVGNTVKSFKNILDFAGNSQIISDAVIPNAVAVSAPRGSVYIHTNGTSYQKIDNGLSTNWAQFNTGVSSNVSGGSPSTVFSSMQAIVGGTP